jgi:hypothetical protein
MPEKREIVINTGPLLALTAAPKKGAEKGVRLYILPSIPRLRQPIRLIITSKFIYINFLKGKMYNLTLLSSAGAGWNEPDMGYT